MRGPARNARNRARRAGAAGGRDRAEALAPLDAGIPVVTFVGTRHAERMGASIMGHLGLPELDTPTEAAYVDLAGALANNPSRRARVAARVAEKFAAAATTDPARYTCDLEATLATAIAARLRRPD
jgi:predicted O-linked N-acetylglucosamine transferase (SPINDLY family)